jgi:uncharacterized protein (TIGR03067 family)
MTRALALVGALAVAVGTTAADDTGKAGGPGGLVGTYTIVSGERDGKKIPDEQFKGAVVMFTKDRITATDKDKKAFFAATYTADATARPMRLAMTSTEPKAGERATGIVEVSGDQLTICYNLPGGDAPTEFKTKEKQQCFVLKRTKAGDEK